jgi:hypothetical protein
MELTSNPDILRVAKDGSEFFVNGIQMHFTVRPSGNCWLRGEGDKNITPEFNDKWYYVRAYDNVALMADVEELIALLKSGKFEIS